MSKYEHIISLGFACNVSLELERMGLRDCSGPFDWVYTEIESMLKLIDNKFEDFLSTDYIQQYSSNQSYYVNIKYNIRFFHDFDKYKKFGEQIQEINAKYKRRTDRFYKNIQKPTLFIRYMIDQAECNYIESHYNEIVARLRKYNPKNDLIFVSNDDISSSKIKIYKVKADKDDVLSRRFLEQNSELKEFLCSGIYDEQKRIANYKVYKNKVFKEKLLKYPNKCLNIYKKLFFKVKINDALYNQSTSVKNEGDIIEYKKA